MGIANKDHAEQTVASDGSTWIDDAGYERGVSLCGVEVSQHPNDGRGGFDRCPNCGVVTCCDCRDIETRWCTACTVESAPIVEIKTVICCSFHDAGGHGRLACGGDLPNNEAKHSEHCSVQGGGDCTCGVWVDDGDDGLAIECAVSHLNDYGHCIEVGCPNEGTGVMTSGVGQNVPQRGICSPCLNAARSTIALPCSV